MTDTDWTNNVLEVLREDEARRRKEKALLYQISNLSELIAAGRDREARLRPILSLWRTIALFEAALLFTLLVILINH